MGGCNATRGMRIHEKMMVGAAILMGVAGVALAVAKLSGVI